MTAWLAFTIIGWSAIAIWLALAGFVVLQILRYPNRPEKWL